MSMSMSTWDKEYFDEEVPAYVQIEKNLTGDFHFGYIQAEINDRIVRRSGDEFFEFTFDGGDNGGGNDVSGGGWVKLTSKNNAEGEIKFHQGDDSTFKLKRIRQ